MCNCELDMLKMAVQNHFYIVLANLIVCTSLKAFIEFAFVVPYYLLQSDGVKRVCFSISNNFSTKTSQSGGYFATEYEFAIFNFSVFADYGILDGKCELCFSFGCALFLASHCC